MSSTGGGNRYTRFIPHEEIAAAAPWRFVAVDDRVRVADELAAQSERERVAETQPAYLQKIQDAYEAGRQVGHEDGRAEATREGNARLDDYIAGEGQAAAERIATLASSMADCLVAAQERIGAQVLEMACALARQVLRRELAIDPQALLPVVREAMGQLVADGRPATVRLHPQDLEVLRGPLQDEYAGVPVAWVADVAMAPGGCQVESAGAVVDGRLQSRWDRAVAALGVDAAWSPVPDEPSADENASA